MCRMSMLSLMLLLLLLLLLCNFDPAELSGARKTISENVTGNRLILPNSLRVSAIFLASALEIYVAAFRDKSLIQLKVYD